MLETRTDCARAGNETRPARTSYASHGQKPRTAPLEGGAFWGGPSHERTPRGERQRRRPCGLTRDSTHYVVWAAGRPIRGRGRATPPAPAPVPARGGGGGWRPARPAPPACRPPGGRNAPRPRPSRCRGPGGGGAGGGRPERPPRARGGTHAGREAGSRRPGPWVRWAIAPAGLNTAGAVVPPPGGAPAACGPRARPTPPSAPGQP